MFHQFRVLKNFMLLSDMSRFSVENLLSHGVEEFREKESFRFSLFSVIEKVWIRSGESIKNFRRKFFVSRCRKDSKGGIL